MNHIISTFPSSSVKTDVTIHVLLPKKRPTIFNLNSKTVELPFKTLYLLHGAFESPDYWINETELSSLVDEYDLAVVLPFVGNSCYLDTATGENYFSFINDELLNYTHEIFPLSQKREDTFIGGLSMGGYGAIRSALFYPQLYGKVFSLSCAAKTKTTMRFLKNCGITLYNTKDDLIRMENCDTDLFYCINNFSGSIDQLPEFYMACGNSDLFLKSNNEFVSKAEESGIKITYIISPGNHDWKYWRSALEPAIKWLIK